MSEIQIWLAGQDTQLVWAVGGTLALALVFLAARAFAPPPVGGMGQKTAARVALPPKGTGIRSRNGLVRLAVLPLTDRAPSPDHPYLAAGLTEDFIVLLARNPRLEIIPIRMNDAPPQRETEILSIADFVLEGSLRCQERRVELALQLIDAETGEQAWHETYEASLQTLAEIQDEATEAICGALGVAYPSPGTDAADPDEARTVIAEALRIRAEALLPGVYTADQAGEAERLLRHAVALRPREGRNQALLAQVLSQRAALLNGPDPRADRLEARRRERLALHLAGRDQHVMAAVATSRAARGEAEQATRGLLTTGRTDGLAEIERASAYSRLKAGRRNARTQHLGNAGDSVLMRVAEAEGLIARKAYGKAEAVLAELLAEEPQLKAAPALAALAAAARGRRQEAELYLKALEERDGALKRSRIEAWLAGVTAPPKAKTALKALLPTG